MNTMNTITDSIHVHAVTDDEEFSTVKHILELFISDDGDLNEKVVRANELFKSDYLSNAAFQQTKIYEEYDKFYKREQDHKKIMYLMGEPNHDWSKIEIYVFATCIMFSEYFKNQEMYTALHPYVKRYIEYHYDNEYDHHANHETEEHRTDPVHTAKDHLARSVQFNNGILKMNDEEIQRFQPHFKIDGQNSLAKYIAAVKDEGLRQRVVAAYNSVSGSHI